MSMEPNSDYIERVIEFYDKNGEDFYSRTEALDMASLYERFLPFIPVGGAILDAGCGSGRDALNFKILGYRVSAFDASSTLSNLASKNSGLDVRTLTFSDMDYLKDFDGVWCCASLLHLNNDDLDDALQKIHRAIRPDGICFQSFKSRTPQSDSRYFNVMSLQELVALNQAKGYFQILDSWESEDVRQDQRTEVWANVVVRKNG